MKKIHILLTIMLFSVIISGPIFPWEPYDKVIAVINNEPIVESEINDRYELMKRMKMLPGKNVKYNRSRVLDYYIENALIKETANEESIIISDTRVLSHIEKVIKQYYMQKLQDVKKVEALVPKLITRLSNRMENKKQQKNKELDDALDEFIHFLKTNQKIDFNDYFEEIRVQLRKEQVMSISIGITPPTEQEVIAWYNKNKSKLGYDVHVKHILIKPKGNSFTAEKETNNLLGTIRQDIISGKASFEDMAKKYSQDPGSAKNGGDIGWTMLAELDPYFANVVYQMNRKNQISHVFKSGFGYHIVKYLGRRNVTYEKVKRMIIYKLYNEKMQEQFKNWVIQKKKVSDIKIYMSDYINENKS